MHSNPCAHARMHLGKEYYMQGNHKIMREKQDWLGLHGDKTVHVLHDFKKPRRVHGVQVHSKVVNLEKNNQEGDYGDTEDLKAYTSTSRKKRRLPFIFSPCKESDMQRDRAGTLIRFSPRAFLSLHALGWGPPGSPNLQGEMAHKNIESAD